MSPFTTTLLHKLPLQPLTSKSLKQAKRYAAPLSPQHFCSMHDASTPRGKTQVIEDWVNDLPYHIPFFDLTKTHLNNLNFEAKMRVKNFTAVRAVRIGIRKGATAIFMHDSFTPGAMHIFINSYCEESSVHAKRTI